jgi:hypothetical protein
MKRTIAHALTVLVLMAAAGAPSEAQDYQCKNAGGCVARKSKNGKLSSVKFRKGDLVSTEDGWVVDPDDGWKKVLSPSITNS